MKFRYRLGIEPEKVIQLDDVDDQLRNRIINAYSRLTKPEARYVLDKMGETISDSQTMASNLRSPDVKALKGYLSYCEWYELYEVIEYSYEYLLLECKNCEFLESTCELCVERENCDEYSIKLNMVKQINNILEEEKSGYRLVGGEVTDIINSTEIETIEISLQSPYEVVRIHLQKALELYSDRKNPDYENSIKESISAVESMAATIMGPDEKNVTLGRAIKKLKEKEIYIHQALEDAFSKLYGYASDEAGIRHGKIDFKKAPAEDAKYMLVACSAFVNYLTEKYVKSKGA